MPNSAISETPHFTISLLSAKHSTHYAIIVKGDFDRSFDFDSSPIGQICKTTKGDYKHGRATANWFYNDPAASGKPVLRSKNATPGTIKCQICVTYTGLVTTDGTLRIEFFPNAAEGAEPKIITRIPSDALIGSSLTKQQISTLASSLSPLLTLKKISKHDSHSCELSRPMTSQEMKCAMEQFRDGLASSLNQYFQQTETTTPAAHAE